MSISTVTQPIAPNWSNINCNSLITAQQPYAEYYISGLTGDFSNNQLTGDGTIVYSALAPGSTSLIWTPTYNTGNIQYTTGYWTMPTAGRYLISMNLSLTGITAGHTYAKLELWHYTYNGGEDFKSFIINPSGMASISDGGVLSTSYSWTTYMAVGDQMSFLVTVYNGQKVVGFYNVGSEQYNNITIALLG